MRGRVFHNPEPRCAAVTSKNVMGASKNVKSFFKSFEKKCLKHRILINLEPLRYNYKVFRQRTLLVFKHSLDRREEPTEELVFNLAALGFR